MSNQVTKTQAIKSFLLHATHRDLANLYSPEMECQVNVAQDGGIRVEGDYQGHQWHGWTDVNGLETWKSFRVPFNAGTDPSYTDSLMKFDIAKHADGIGMTGWDWKNKKSKWVAFDFDAITGHSDKHTSKLDSTQLAAVQEAAAQIPWVTVRKSTSGKGLHLYVFLEPVSTNNHHEHAALARAILGKMAATVNFDFSSKVDICGGNMWCWHRKMIGTDGLTLIKPGIQLTIDQIPLNWKDHIKVVTRRKKRATPDFVEKGESEKMFEELCGQRSTVALDDEHKKLIKWLEDNGCQSWWDNDHGMLVCHTYDLKQAHEELTMRGVFFTEAQGTEKGIDHNAFCFPLRRGAWSVRRFTPGVKEHTTWEQDGSGWTMTYLNREPDLSAASRAFEGIESAKGGFVFRHAEQAAAAAALLGVHHQLSPEFLTRPAVLKEHNDGRLIFQMEYSSYDKPENMLGWLNEKGKWQRIFNVQVSAPVEDTSIANLDDTVRHTVTSEREDAGWVVRSDDRWSLEPLTHVREALAFLGVNPKEIKQVIGQSVIKPWEIVNLPFQPEYPGDRKWNREAAQFRFPLKLSSDVLKYPTWTKILNHLGKSLDDVVKVHPWASAHGLISGADYLKCWIASLFQEPAQPLPYLFFWGGQDCGKSIFHEALNLLLTKGCVRVDTALTSSSNFNGELENAVICVIEETDLKRNKTAYNRIKDWVTSPMLSIHRKGQTPYTTRNTTHYIQCSNEYTAGPIFPGDTRITMVHVGTLNPTEMIPKKQIIPLLEAEASDFLTSVLSLELPPSNDRLNIPIIETEDKITLAKSNQTLLESFLEDRCYPVIGERIRFGDLYDRFVEYADPSDLKNWSKIRVGRELPPQYPKGRCEKDNYHYVGNISFTPYDAKIHTNPRYIVKGAHLVHES